MAIVEFTRDGPVGVVRLNRPERLNAISTALTGALHRMLFAAMNDPTVKALVLTGAGRAFCAGDDLKEFDQQTASPEAAAAHIEGIQRITRDLMFADKLVVGAIHGYAVGGGFEWMLNCDMIVAADDLTAFFPEMDWGQFVTGGVTHLLPQAVGHQQAMELMALGERQSAEALRARGLVNWVLPAERTLPKALEVAHALAGKSTASLAALKRLMTRGLSSDLGRALDLEQAITIERFGTREAAERVRGFAERPRGGG